jgi:hypothetical protein
MLKDDQSIKHPPEEQPTTDQQPQQQDPQKEFKEKWQIRCGNHYLHASEGMLPNNLADEKYFETTTTKKILHYLENFYSKIDVLNKYKKNKRSYLLHSEPGMGKSALLRHLCRRALNIDGMAIITVPGGIDFGLLTHVFIRDYHSDVKMILLIIEDMGNRDYSNNQNFYNSTCLNFLDGQEGLFRVPTLIVATTNFAKELGHQFTNRPGRFNKIIKVQPPTDTEIFELIEGYSGNKLTDEVKQALSGREFTPDHCIEVILRSEIEGLSLPEAADEIKKEREGLINFNGNN